MIRLLYEECVLPVLARIMILLLPTQASLNGPARLVTASITDVAAWSRHKHVQPTSLQKVYSTSYKFEDIIPCAGHYSIIAHCLLDVLLANSTLDTKHVCNMKWPGPVPIRHSIY
ncbi:hypothetical protein V8C26DRAFT_195057 [Trichoderma gracile]